MSIMYTHPVSSVHSKAKDIKHHLYADDTQVHNSLNMSSFDDSNQKSSKLPGLSPQLDVQNKLKLNPDKTEILLIGNKCHSKDFASSFSL